jgi:hypothetical protein
MERSRVFVTQEPSKFDHEAGVQKRYMDLTPALKYGEIVVCLPASANFINTAPLVRAMKEKMKDFGPDDYLLAVGDPVAMQVASAIADRNCGGKWKTLKWDRKERQYQPIEVLL